MRTSFSKDKLSAAVPTEAKCSHLFAAGLCSILTLVILALIAVRNNQLQSQLAKFDLNGTAAASAAFAPRICAERDIKFVTLLEDASAAKSAPAEQLYQAYLIMTKARELCSLGRFAEGIAVYDTITPAHAVAR